MGGGRIQTRKITYAIYEEFHNRGVFVGGIMSILEYQIFYNS